MLNAHNKVIGALVKHARELDRLLDRVDLGWRSARLPPPEAVDMGLLDLSSMVQIDMFDGDDGC